MSEKPMADYYKFKDSKVAPTILHNRSMLERLDRDIQTLTSQVKDLADYLRVIKQYIEIKRDKENARWFY